MDAAATFIEVPRSPRSPRKPGHGAARPEALASPTAARHLRAAHQQLQATGGGRADGPLAASQLNFTLPLPNADRSHSPDSSDEAAVGVGQARAQRDDAPAPTPVVVERRVTMDWCAPPPTTRAMALRGTLQDVRWVGVDIHSAQSDGPRSLPRTDPRRAPRRAPYAPHASHAGLREACT